MPFETTLSKIADLILLPPGVNFVLVAVSYYLLAKAPKAAKSLLVVSFFSLLLFSLPFVAQLLNQSLQEQLPLSQKEVKELAKSEGLAIVVLSGGRIELAPEYGDIDTVSALTLQRIQYASWLHSKTNLPILVSGGSVFGESTPEAVLMNQTMVSAFNISPKWIEHRSRNTKENAQFSAEILFNIGITQILLVTHASHMPRAKAAFENYGFSVIAAPTVYEKSRKNWTDFFPSAAALNKSSRALHEKLGRIWYSMRY